MASSGIPNVVDKDGERIKSLASANTRFALALYKEQAKEQKLQAGGGNIFMSPISISMALAMTYLGARGETMSEMKKSMLLDDVTDADVHETFKAVRETLGKNDESCQLHLANRLFGQESYKFLEDYLQSSAKFYGSTLATVDFVRDSQGAVEQINRWVYDNTSKKIKDALSIDGIDELTRLVIVNAIYFKGDWNQKFRMEQTREEDFHVSPTEKVKVQMMSMRSATHRYGECKELKCKAIELHYKGKALSMFVLLPTHKETSIEELESMLTADHLDNIDTKFTLCGNRDPDIWLPRFKLDETLQLKEILKKLGLSELFTVGTADLSGMNGTKELYCSAAVHKAVVEVNEEGTEAAAFTGMVMRCCSMTKYAEFRADRPFLFFIRENKTKTVLFIGKVARP